MAKRKRISMIGTTRKIGGERMRLVGGRSRTKGSAKRTAKPIRGMGYRTRVVKHAGGFAVYRGGKKR